MVTSLRLSTQPGLSTQLGPTTLAISLLGEKPSLVHLPPAGKPGPKTDIHWGISDGEEAPCLKWTSVKAKDYPQTLIQTTLVSSPEPGSLFRAAETVRSPRGLL